MGTPANVRTSFSTSFSSNLPTTPTSSPPSTPIISSSPPTTSTEPILPPLFNPPRKRQKHDHDASKIEEAIQYKVDHPWMPTTEICKLYDIPNSYKTITSRIKNYQYIEKPYRTSNKGRPSILSDDDIDALKAFIDNQFKGGLAANQELIASVIEGLFKQKGINRSPSESYLKKLFKHPKLCTIKKRRTKVLDIKRKSTQNPAVIRKWYKDFRDYCLKRGFDKKPEKIWNFDESGFRVGMMREEVVYIPANAPDVYQDNPENHKQVTLVEGINTAGGVLPPMIIIEGQYHLSKWFNSNQTGAEVIQVSNSGYTNSQIAIN